MIPMKLNDSKVHLDLDTRVSVSVISEQTWNNSLTSVPLQASRVTLKTYSGERLKVPGQTDVSVEYHNQVAKLPVFDLRGRGPDLMGRSWLGQVNLDWGYIKKVSTALGDLLKNHAELFEEGIGTMKGMKAKLHSKEGSIPIFCKPRSVPFALREAIEMDLDQLEGIYGCTREA